MDLIQFQQNLIDIDVWELLKPILDKRLENVEKMNREQLSEGKMSDGKSTPSHSGGAMSEIYVDSKIERGVYNQSLYPAMNLYNTGDFYRGIRAYIEDSGITIESNDEKGLELETKYSSRIYGLTPENLTKLTKLCVDELVKSIHTAMFKN